MGKKNKNKNQTDKKPRFNGVKFSLDGIPVDELKTLQFGVRQTGLGIEIAIRTDQRQIHTDFITGYQRPNKPGFKRTNTVTNTTLTSVEQNIINFDWLMAIDTNTSVILEKKVHFGFAVEIVSMTQQGLKFINPEFRYAAHFTFSGDYEKPELMNWKQFIEFVIKDAGYTPEKKIGIIVDSELGNIQAYNKREIPIIDNFFLPRNFQLLYASADAQNDSVFNQAIAYCDKSATEILNEMKNGSILPDETQNPRLNNTQASLRHFLPVLFELLEPQNISDSDWKYIDEKVEEWLIEMKRQFAANNNYLRVEVNLYGVIIETMKGDKSATKMYEFIYLTLLDLNRKLAPDQKKQIRDTLRKMLLEFNKDFRNHFAELAVLNTLLNNGYSLLHVETDEIYGDKKADFTIEKDGEVILVEVVSIHIYKPIDRLSDFINGKIIDKLNKKTNNGSVHRPFKLMPVIWAYPPELAKYRQEYKAGAFQLPENVHEPFAYSTVCTDEENDIWDHRFWKISCLYSSDNIEVVKE